MKKQIRKMVFETNSSSVHTICLCDDGMEKNKMPLDKEGNIIAYLGVFGKEDAEYKTQEEKLSYILTRLYCSSGMWSIDDLSVLYENYNFNCLEKKIKEYTGCNGIIINKDKLLGEEGYYDEPHIDHQSDEDIDDIIFSYDDEVGLIQIIFNKNVSIKTTCD